jgi:hypothetical protein
MKQERMLAAPSEAHKIEVISPVASPELREEELDLVVGGGGWLFWLPSLWQGAASSRVNRSLRGLRLR